MTSWKKGSVIAGMMVVFLLVGQGCVQDSNTTTGQNTNTGTQTGTNTGTNTNTNTSDEDDYTKVACASGTKRYVSEKANVTFCYPETVENQAVTIEDTANDVKVKVGDEVVRVIAVEKVDKDVNQTNKVMEYAVDPTHNTITCQAQKGATTNGRTEYMIVGLKGGQQTMAATDACIASTKLKNALDDQGVGKFYFYDDEEELIIVSTSQDAVLGQLTDEFEASIWPRE